MCNAPAPPRSAEIAYLVSLDDFAVCLAYRAGNRRAGDEILRRYEKLAKYFANRLCGQLAFDEALQAGRLGVLRAADLWDPDRGAFSTYASIWARSMIRRARQAARVVMVPYYRQDRYSRAAVEDIPPAYQHALPLEDAYDDETASDPAFLDDAPTPEEALISETDQRMALAGMARLSRRSRRILRDHVMGEKTLRELGDEFGVSPEWVRLLERAALKRLRKEMARGA